MARGEWQLLPTFSAELAELRENGFTMSLLYDILRKHQPNSDYNRELYLRYMGVENGVPIFDRVARYKKDNEINNKVNNDFFGEIVDFKVGYFAGEPISYGYSETEESEEDTGGKEAVEKVKKTLSDFTTRNNMFAVDMETTKNASIYGYSGRLFFVKDGEIRVMAVHGYETIILSETDIAEPEYAIRYYKSLDLNGAENWTVEFYDNKNVTIYKGNSLYSLTKADTREHLFDFCPLQGIANNKECIGDAEKVLSLIDDYDKVVSDNSNEIEGFVHAMLLVSLLGDKNQIAEDIERANENGILNIIPAGSTQVNEPVKWLTKQINDAFTEHHLERVEDNIYRFSRTPNLGDESFGSASGVSLKFKLHGLETKCSTFEANVMNSAQHMWRVLCSVWAKYKIMADPLQFTMDFSRNFPLDTKSEAETVNILKGTGLLSKKTLLSRLSFVDDAEYEIEAIKAEQEDITPFYETDDEDDDIDDKNNKNNNQPNDKTKEGDPVIDEKIEK